MLEHSHVFEGKVAAVTGANRANGIGAAVAIEFARQGAQTVYITGRTETPDLEQFIIPKITELGAEGRFIQADLVTREGVENTIDTIRRGPQRLDVLVNNAGHLGNKPFFMLDWDTVDQTLGVDLKAPMMLTALACNRRSPLFPKEGAVVVNIGSIVGVYGHMGQESYAAAKAGLAGFTKAAAQDLARIGVRMFTVNPGFAATEMTSGIDEHARKVLTATIPTGDFLQPQDIANMVVDLCDSKRYAHLTGEVINLDGGVGGAFTALIPLRSAGLLAKPDPQ